MNTTTDLATSGSAVLLLASPSLTFKRFRQPRGAPGTTMKGLKERFRVGLVKFLVFFFALSTVKAQVGRVIAQRTFPSVVMLTMESANGEGRYLGSGFFVREGIVATNLHVVEGSAKGFARVVDQKTEHEVAGIVGFDRERDLVLLSVPGVKAPSLPLGDSGRVAAGDEVYVVGNPEGLEGTFSQGIVSAIRQVGPGTLIQITAPISPGSSGGPVVNSRGEVIGIAAATLETGQNLNFAVPASYLASLLTQLKPVRPLFAEAGSTESPRMRRTPPRSESTPSEAQPAVGSHSQRCAQLLDAGSALESKGESSTAIQKFREAELECRAAVQLDPGNSELHADLSVALHHQNKVGESVEEAREAVHLNPNNELAHFSLGDALKRKGDLDGAIAEYREAVRLDPNSEWAHDGLGAALANKGDSDGAIAEYREMLRLNPTNAHAHLGIGAVLASRGNLDEAIAEYFEAVRLDPNSEWAHDGLCLALADKGDLKGAIAECREALRLSPDSEFPLYGLGHALERMGNREDALEEYRAAYMLNPHSVLVRTAYETLLQKLNATRQLEKLQHWLGTWIFAGPVKFSAGCGGRFFPLLDRDIPSYSFKVLSISPSGEVTAHVEHPLRTDESATPDWSGTATDTTLMLTMDPIPPGTPLLGSGKLKWASGRLEAHRGGDRYSVEFTYSNSWTSLPKQGCSDYAQEYKRFLGQMRRP